MDVHSITSGANKDFLSQRVQQTKSITRQDKKMKHKTMFKFAVTYLLLASFNYLIFTILLYDFVLKSHSTQRMKEVISKTNSNNNSFTLISKENVSFEKDSKTKITYTTKSHALFISRRTMYENIRLVTDFEYFYNESTSDNLQNSLLHRHKFKFILNNGYKCTGNNVFIVILINVAPKETTERQIIRSTYGSLSKINDKRIEYIFVLGMTDNPTLQKEIEQESQIYKDIVQSNFIDSYKNLTYKHVFALYWVRTFCTNSKFVIKTDSDVLVNTPAIVKYLDMRKTKNTIGWNFIQCEYRLRSFPFRRPNSKWYMPKKTYPFSNYPPNCLGYAIIMPIGVVEKLLEASKQVPFFWIDDVYVTGFLSWVARIKLNMPNSFVKKLPDQNYDVPFLFYLCEEKGIHRLIYLRNIWKTILLNYNVNSSYNTRYS